VVSGPPSGLPVVLVSKGITPPQSNDSTYFHNDHRRVGWNYFRQ
jgi:hypothetical protein